MSDIEKIILGAFGAIVVFVIGQILSRFFIDPISDLRKEIGSVRYNLAFYSRVIHSPIIRTKELSGKAEEALLGNSAQLVAKIHAVPLFAVTRFLACGVIPSRLDIEEASVQIRALSTYLHQEGEKAEDKLDVIASRVKKIENHLGLRSLK